MSDSIELIGVISLTLSLYLLQLHWTDWSLLLTDGQRGEGGEGCDGKEAKDIVLNVKRLT